MTWTHAYRAYDDDTLATLANAGLLRRAAKDVEAGKVQWQRQGDTDGVVQADGQQVQLDARGAVYGDVKIGAMIEIPAAALTLNTFLKYFIRGVLQ